MESFHGIENLTRDSQGYVAWKGKVIEHYSFHDKEKERMAAEALSERCRAAESKGFPINVRTTGSDAFFQAPADTPWLEAMLYYYTVFMDKESGKAKWLILYLPENTNAVVAMEVAEGKVVTRYNAGDEYTSGAYFMFHELQNEGMESCVNRLSTYSGFVACMHDAGITPEMVASVLKQGMSIHEIRTAC